MDRTATSDSRMANVEQDFERSRLSEEVLASAYERLLPLVRRAVCFPQEHFQTCRVDWQLRQTRRAS